MLRTVAVGFLLFAGIIAMSLDPVRAAELSITDRARPPVVVLAWDNTGDYGPGTPGTRTAGWQEAVDACVREKRDLYVKGGWGGRDAIYHVAETIHVPATQDFRISGGVYVANWTGPADRDLIRIDSGMDCHFAFGILVYGGTGAALRIRPENPVPIDGFAVFVDSDVSASSIADPHPFTRGKREGGAGVVFDTEKAPITHADFSFTAVLNFATCIVTPDAGKDFSLNRVACGHLHTNADSSTLIRIGAKSRQNAFDIRVGVDQGAQGVIGASISGTNDRIDVASRGGFPDGTEIVLERPARGNRIDFQSRETGAPGAEGAAFDPAKHVTDRADLPSNALAWTGPPAPIRTIRLTPDASGVAAFTQRLYPAIVVIAPESVRGDASVDLVRGDARVPRSAESEITLGVGDRLEIRARGPVDAQVVPQR